MNDRDFRVLADLASAPGDDGAFLVEVGRRVTGPRAGWRIYRWSRGTLAAGVSPDGTQIRLGDTDERAYEVALTHAELAALTVVCGDWERRRHVLWSFVSQRGAFRAPSYYCVRAGDAGDRTDVPGPWRGADEEVSLPVAQTIVPGAELLAKVVRRGEDVAPDGAQVAVIYRAGDLRIIGRRGSVEVERAGSRLLIGPDDVAVLVALLAIVAG